MSRRRSPEPQGWQENQEVTTRIGETGKRQEGIAMAGRASGTRDWRRRTRREGPWRKRSRDPRRLALGGSRPRDQERFRGARSSGAATEFTGARKSQRGVWHSFRAVSINRGKKKLLAQVENGSQRRFPKWEALEHVHGKSGGKGRERRRLGAREAGKR